MSQEPFSGLKVLDFTWGVAGPLTTKYLADYGATVVRVESPARPCGTRVSPPFQDRVPGVDRAGYFAFFNANKYSLSLNLNHPRATEVLNRLVGWADIVAESYSPGTMEKWGLDYEKLREVKPDIIMLRSSSQGQDGPHASFSAFGIPLVGLAGFSHFTGWPDGSCLPLPSAYSDLISPRFAAAALAAALDYRRRTGEGQYLDQSQLESALQFLAPAILDYEANGTVARRVGNRDPYAAPHGAYRCLGEDRWCAIAVTNEDEWRAFCEVIGAPAWTSEERFQTLAGRKMHEDELDRLVETWTEAQRAEDVMVMMQAAGVPAGVVQNAEDLFKDPQLAHREHFAVLDHPEIGPYHIATSCFRLSECSNKPTSPAPLLGEHNEFVLEQFLGMSKDEIADLVAEGVLE